MAPDAETSAPRLHIARAELIDAAGPLGAGAAVSVTVGEQGISVLGGEPPAAWQIPLATLRGTRLSVRRSIIEIAAWVAGVHLRIRFNETELAGGSLDNLGRILEAPPMVSRSRARSARRRPWLVVVVIGGLLVGLGSWLIVRNVGEGSRAARAADRAQAASVNLSRRQLPTDFVADDPTTSPLAGLLGTAPSTTPTPAEHRTTRAIEDRYRSCLGVSEATDREFGRAGVVPVVEVPGLPYGRIGASGGIEEVGTVTQRYASAAEVAADRRQMELPKFSTCFAAALARFVAGSATASVAASTQHVTQPFGAWATGGTAVVEIAGTSGNVPVEIGVTLLLAGRDEQYVYTFASSDTFPPSLRQTIVAEQGPRLGGLSSSTTA